MTILFFGIALSLLGSLPPGLISLTVAQTALQRGLAAALVLAFGAAAAEFFQALLAVALSDWFLSNRHWGRWFELGAVPVFGLMGVHLLFFAKAPDTPDKQRAGFSKNLFWKGVAVSAFNMLAIPYWFVYVGWLRMNGWWRAGIGQSLLFALGVTAGPVCALLLYGLLSDRLLGRSRVLAQWANRIIGLIFLGMAAKLVLG